jgi:hypothetical protein
MREDSVKKDSLQLQWALERLLRPTPKTNLSQYPIWRRESNFTPTSFEPTRADRSFIQNKKTVSPRRNGFLKISEPDFLPSPASSVAGSGKIPNLRRKLFVTAPRKVIDVRHRRTIAVFVKRTLPVNHFVEAIFEACPGTLKALKKACVVHSSSLLGVKLTPTMHRRRNLSP